MIRPYAVTFLAVRYPAKKLARAETMREIPFIAPSGISDITAKSESTRYIITVSINATLILLYVHIYSIILSRSIFYSLIGISPF